MRRTGQGQLKPTERGAVAVEFALLTPILAGFLFGIVQYGYGLFQYQAFSNAMNDASRIVATGVSGCTQLTGMVGGLVEGNGLPISADNPLTTSVQWFDLNGNPSATPVRLGFASVTGVYENPTNFNIPLVPFPDSFTVTKRVMVQDLTQGVTDNLLGCARITAA